MKPVVIGIAGGSGSGKSTVAVALCKKYSDRACVLHLDDYFKPSSEAPTLGNFVNWDSPDALRFNDFYNDLVNLINGNKVTILTKSELYNPDYRQELKNKLSYTIEPRPIILVEGYLALYDQRIRELIDLKIYLDISIEESSRRRSVNKFAIDTGYFNQVLAPMHHQFVEPTKKFADLIIDVTCKNAEQVAQEIDTAISALVRTTY